MSIKPVHSKLGASSAYRWKNCPGSVALCASCPPAPTSAVAAEGTAAHEFAEKVLSGTPAAMYYVMQKAKFNGYDATEEMAEHVQGYVDYVRNLKNLLGGDLLVEHKFHLAHLHPDFYGTCDAIVAQPFGELHVIDFKYGAGISVEVEENEQIMYYALGALSLGDHSKIVLHVYQPRIEHGDGIARAWETTAERLMEFGKELRAAALVTQKKDAPLASGDQCRFCAAAGICPELHKNAMELARSDFREDALPETKAMTHAQIAKVIKMKPLLESWLDAVKAQALLALMQGEKIEGLKLVTGRGRREWTSEREAAAALTSKLGAEAYKRELLSVSQAEKALGKDYVKGMFTTIAGVPTVAPADDKRRALTTAKDDFENDVVILESDF